MEPPPDCAICYAPAASTCTCESERLQIAVKQAELRVMEPILNDVRDWVINHAREHIFKAFQQLTSARKQAHAHYLSSLPNYTVYMAYSGHPPIHQVYIAQLQGQIAEAHAELKRGIDADWRASVVRYPDVLQYFYSLVEVRLPDELSPQVSKPPFAQAGYADSGYEQRAAKEMKRKKRHQREASVPMVETQVYSVANRTMRGVPPPVATPPIHGRRYPPPPPPPLPPDGTYW